MDRPQRPQRNIQPIDRLRPNNQPVQPRRQAPIQAQAAPVQAAPRQAPRQQRQPRQPRRELNLRLTRAEAGMFDIGDPDSEFWDMYFDKPNDEITDIRDALDYADIKFNTVALQSGITNYDLKNIDTVPLKPVSFEKFKVGDYHDGRSNSDMKVYAGRIRGMTNKYDEFAQYKNQDDLLWIVRRNRELMCNILEYHIPENNSASAIEAELVAMLRIIYLAFESKLNPLYLKYQAIIADMKKNTLDREYDNSFNEAELAKGGLIPWEMVKNKQKELEDRFEKIDNKKSKFGYELNQLLLLISLYSLIPPLRLEIMTLKFTREEHTEGDWIYMKDDGTIVLDLNDEKKKHGSIELKLPDNLQRIIRESYRLYPREHAFTSVTAYPKKMDKAAALTTMQKRLATMFKDSTFAVGASMLRSSYVTYRYNERLLSYNEKLDIARQMRTSVQMMDTHYLKIITQPADAIVDIPDDVINAVARPGIGRQPEQGPRVLPRLAKPVLIVKKKPDVVNNPQERNAYHRHLEANRDYYERKRDNVLAEQKLYRATPERRKADACRKIVNMLNKSPDYRRVVRQTTINKYDIQVLNCVYF